MKNYMKIILKLIYINWKMFILYWVLLTLVGYYNGNNTLFMSVLLSLSLMLFVNMTAAVNIYHKNKLKENVQKGN